MSSTKLNQFISEQRSRVTGKAILLTLIILITASGCIEPESKSKGSISPDEQVAPLNLSCENNLLGAVGVVFSSTPPALEKGSSPTYYITPALPSGLSLDSNTGKISGTPSAAQAATSFTLLATNSYGQATCAFSATIDGTAPTSVTITQPGTQLASLTNLAFSWTASTDSESGILKYEYSVGTAPQGSDLVAWTDNALSISKSLTLSGLTGGQVFFFNVRVTSRSGLTNVSSSSAITYLATSGAYFSSQTVSSWGTDSDGNPQANDYVDEAFHCSTAVCTRIHTSTTSRSLGAILMRPVGAQGVYWFDSVLASNRYCDFATPGCTSMLGSITSYYTYFSSIGGIWAANAANDQYNCVGPTCTVLAANPVSSWLLKTPTKRFSATSGSRYLHFIDSSQYGFLTAPNSATFYIFGSNVSQAYKNGADKAWFVSLRSGTYYILTCSTATCTEIASIGATAPQFLYSTLVTNAVWVKLPTSLLYCSETACSTVSAATTGYSVSVSLPISGVDSVYLSKAGSTLYCSTSGCSSAIASVTQFLGADGGGNGIWLNDGANLKYCAGSTCTGTLALAAITSNIAMNTQSHGAWTSGATGIQYCQSTGCTLIDATSANFQLPQTDSSATGVWAYDTVAYTMKYCTTTSCTTLSRPATMQAVAGATLMN